MRFKNTLTARYAQDAKHARKNIITQGIAFFMIIRPDQEKTKIQPWRPLRLSGSRISATQPPAVLLLRKWDIQGFQ
jgi:hypothetical protein